jgi:WD40 repeat protein
MGSTFANSPSHDNDLIERKSPRADDLRKVFDSFDINQAGHVDLPTLVIALKELGVTSCLYTARRILESLDLNQSGCVEFDDFERFFATARDFDGVKRILTTEALRLLNYKLDAESGDPNFAIKYRIPTCHKPDHHYAHHMDVVQGLAWLDGRRFISASLDGSLALWSSETQSLEKCFKPTESSIYSLSRVEEHGLVLTGHCESVHSLNLVNVENQTIQCSYLIPNEHAVMSCDSSRTTAVTGLKSGTVLLFDLNQGHPVSTFAVSETLIESVSFNKTATCTLAAADHVGKVSVIDTRSGSLVVSFEGSLGRVACTQWLNTNELLTGGDDFIIRRFDIRKLGSFQSEAVGAFLGHSSPVTSLEIVGNDLLSGSLDGSVRIWKMESSIKKSGNVKFQPQETDGTTVATTALIGHSQAVKCISARVGGKQIDILTGSSDTTINEYLVDC